VSQNDEFISFEKALRDLKLQSEELRKLVSEGDIRAFKHGDSMRFRPEDVAELRRARGSELDLEDDTGMVTEEISAEDTLLADDEDELLEAAPRKAAAAPAARSSRARAVAEVPSGEPGWVVGAAIVTALLMLFGAAQAYWINAELPPEGIMSMWAPK
jgi:hypothetical protein